jgi:hypothetical protein
MEDLSSFAGGLKLRHIPYKGGAPNASGQRRGVIRVERCETGYSATPFDFREIGNSFRLIERILSWLGLWQPSPACGPSPPDEQAKLTYQPLPNIA